MKQVFTAMTCADNTKINGQYVITLQSAMSIICSFGEANPTFTAEKDMFYLKFNSPHPNITPVETNPAESHPKDKLSDSLKELRANGYVVATAEEASRKSREISPDPDIYGWDTAERLIDKEQIRSWKSEMEKHDVARHPPPPNTFADGTVLDEKRRSNFWTKFFGI